MDIHRWGGKSPGPSIQQIAKQIKAHQSGLLGIQRYRKNAVLIPLIATGEGKTAVLFTKRSARLRRQAGEICFPGGHWEETDESEWMTAARETSEELQLPLHTIRYVGALDVLVTPFQFMIHPFVGVLTDPQLIQANPDEVEEWFSVELTHLLALEPACHEVALKVQPQEGFPYHLIPNGEEYAWRTGKIPELFYEVDGRIIWGLTARILAHFLEVIR